MNMESKVTVQTKEVRRFPIHAGHPKINGYRMQVVGYKVVEFVYEIHADGDKQLISERRIKNVITLKR